MCVYFQLASHTHVTVIAICSARFSLSRNTIQPVPQMLSPNLCPEAEMESTFLRRKSNGPSGPLPLISWNGAVKPPLMEKGETWFGDSFNTQGSLAYLAASTWMPIWNPFSALILSTSLSISQIGSYTPL